jgi:membrane-associated protein
MHEIIDFLRSLTDPPRLIHLLSTVMSGWYGYATLFAIVFSETGLLIGFFLPGDSLLFTVGVVAGAGQLNIILINIVLILAAILGVGTGYSLGRKAGPKVFDRPDSRFFKREHLIRTQQFYEKHGGKTIVYAQFVPIIRTFAPFVAGIGKMSYGKFLSYNVIGGILWIVLLTLCGYFFGNIPVVKKNFTLVIFAIIIISFLPGIFEYLRQRKAARAR